MFLAASPAGGRIAIDIHRPNAFSFCMANAMMTAACGSVLRGPIHIVK
jgi:hypothetical protein